MVHLVRDPWGVGVIGPGGRHGSDVCKWRKELRRKGEGGRGNRSHRNDLGALEEVKGFSRP